MNQRLLLLSEFKLIIISVNSIESIVKTADNGSMLEMSCFLCGSLGVRSCSVVSLNALLL